MKPKHNLAGRRFGNWTATKDTACREQEWGTYCLCVCGQRGWVRNYILLGGKSKSCGCRGGSFTLTHGQSKTATYRVWSSMRRRCRNKHQKAYAQYGALGVTVCKRWNKFENFLADMGVRPTGLTLDRVRNSRGYSPSNCRWATPTQQAENRGCAVLVTWRGVRKPISAWARERNIPYYVLHQRIQKLQWPVNRALTAPVAYLPKRRKLNE